MPNFEQYVNNGVTTLSSGITNSATSLTVNTGTVFPSVGNFRILVDGELMLCTSRTGATLTVVRGIENTAAVTHNAGAQVAFIVTEESFRRLFMDHSPAYLGEFAAGPMNSLTDTNGNAIDSTDFTWINQGTATVTDIGSPVTAILLEPPAGTGANLRILKKTAPSTPYTIYGCFNLQIYPSSAVSHGGFCMRESATAKVKVFGLASGNGSSSAVAIGNYTNPTTFSAWNNSSTYLFGPTVWCYMSDNGTNISFGLSSNGVKYQEIFSETRGTFFTTGPDEVGFYLNTNDASILQWYYMTHWSEQ